MTTVRASERKARGAHFTPAGLARFLASRLVDCLGRDASRPLRVLDPACGDGELLVAFRSVVKPRRTERLMIVGVESDAKALQAFHERLTEREANDTLLLQGDFLDWWAAKREPAQLWERREIPAELGEPFDVAIANPPYVRTQVVGARKAQKLAAAFGLTGRVDLYHPFLIAATEALRPGGLLGVITSNRFMFTQAGAAIRHFLSRSLEVLEIIDLGDTRLFEAAVLPAILVGRKVEAKVKRPTATRTRFLRIYSHPNSAIPSVAKPERAESVYDILDAPVNGVFQLPNGVFDLTVGRCRIPPGTSSPWAIIAGNESAWIERIRRNAVGLVRDVACVRVGIKTTADRVFVRSDWETLPAELQPERAVLHPLLTHEDARRWSRDSDSPVRFKILYTHEVVHGRRQTIDFKRFPKALRYLTSRRSELESRHYVTSAGRKWFEIWVPQDPNAWSEPKIVCPDISPEPRFYLDRTGMLVDGDSYWITLLRGQPHDLLYLILAVANSRLMANFHDLAFHNRLYSGRRRYLTQHVERYPLPDPDRSDCRELIALVKSFLAGTDRSRERLTEFESAVNSLVAAAFSTSVNPIEGEAR